MSRSDCPRCDSLPLLWRARGGLRDGRKHGEATAGAYWHSVRARKVVLITVSSLHLCTCPFRSLTMAMLAPTLAVLHIPPVSATRSWWHWPPRGHLPPVVRRNTAFEPSLPRASLCSGRSARQSAQIHSKTCIEYWPRFLFFGYKVATPCLDDHQFKQEELETVGVCQKLALKLS